MVWTADKARALYARRQAAGACVRCGGAMLPEWRGVRCPTCSEALRAQKATASPAARMRRRELDRARAAAIYAADPNARRVELRARYLEKKIAGECMRCPEPIAPESLYCHAHWIAQLARDREQKRRRREAAAVGAVVPRARMGRPLAPPPEPKTDPAPAPAEVAAEERPWQRLLRAARHFDEVTNEDLREALGIPDDAANHVSTMLSRLAKRGLLERTRGGGRGVPAAYRVTDDGRRFA